MSTVTLRIQVDKSGATENIGEVKRELGAMGQAGVAGGQQAAGGMSALTGAINGAKAAVGAFVAAYAAVQTLTGVVRLADEYQGMSDRLRLATSSTAEFTAAQAGVFAVAQQTGSALGAVNDLYVGLSRSTEQLGLNQGELLTITAAINQSFAISGTSAGAAEAATRQLGQAFASGVLRGDEFNSMMENAPGLASALASSLGVTTGELRKMAAEGKLTSDVLATGLLQQAPAIAEQFGQMGTTVGRAFTQLSNSVLKFVGEASQATGAANALATVIIGISNALPALAFGLTAVAAGYGAITLASAGANAGLFTTAGLVGALATGLGALVVAYSAYKLGEYLVNEFTLVQAAVRSLYVGLNDAWTAIKVGALQAVAAVRVAFITAFDAITDRLADLIEAFVSFSQIELPLGLRADFAYGQAEAMTELARRVRDATDAVVENDEVTGDLKAQMDAARAEAERYAASMFDAVDSLHEGKTATEGTTTATKAFTPAVAAAAKATEAATKAVDLHAQALGVIRASTIAYSSGLGTAVERLADVTGATGTATGAVDGLSDAAERGGTAAVDWGQYWVGASDAVLDAFAGLFSGGIDSLEEFGDQMLRISKQIVGDIIKEFARTGEIKLPRGSDGTTAGNIGAGIQGLGFAYAGYQNARQGGNPLATVGSFTLAGAQIGSIVPIIGTAVGAIIGAVVGAAVAIFGGPGDPLLRVRSSEFSGPRRSEGQAQSALGNIFVRTENTPDGAGTSPEIAQRIADFDNLIAGFLSADQLSVVRTALANVNDTFENGAFTLENALNSRLGTILGVLGDDIDTFVGDAGTLEQRMGRLVDALVISSAAATGIVSSDFGEMATLLTRFRVGAEGLGDTFLRTVAGMSLVDDALLLLGGTFSGTRLQAATFAGELIELAGGFDQFASRLNGALNALFSEDERNQFIADQAQGALNEALRGLNISGSLESVRTQLRDQLRLAMEAGNSALVNSLLIAGNALGAFSTAVGNLGDEAVAAANGLTFGSSSAAGTIGPGAGLTSPAGTAAQTQVQAVQTTNSILSTQTGILQQIQLNTARGVGLTPGASPKTGGDATAVLVQIKGLIEQAVRTQVTEALKRTTGANARAATA